MFLQWISLCSVCKETLFGINQFKFNVNYMLRLIQKTPLLLYWASIVWGFRCKCKWCLTSKLKVSRISYLHHIKEDNAPLYIFSLENQPRKSCKISQITFVRVFPFLFQKARHLICLVLFSIRMRSSWKSKQQN